MSRALREGTSAWLAWSDGEPVDRPAGGAPPADDRPAPAADLVRAARGACEVAVTVARVVQPAWAATRMERRLAPLAALRADLARHGAELAGLSRRLDRAGWLARSEALSAEVVPLADACAFLLRRAGELLAPRRPDVADRPAWLAGVDLELLREPHGVVLVVAPANYPILIPGVQVLQALVAGNAVLLKPGPQGTAAACWLAERLARGGLPEGLLTVLPEDAAAAQEAIEAGVDKVVLTGSATTGAEVLARLAPRRVPATLELSGNDPLIALADADPALVVQALAFGLRLHGGATCIAPRRALVHRRIFDAVEAGLAAAVSAAAATALESALGSAPGSAPRTAPPAAAWPPSGDVAAGMPVSTDERRRARELVAAAVAGGGRLVGGTPTGIELTAGGPPLPLVVAEAPPDAELRAADLFAPVVLLDPVDHVEEAVRRANGGPWALGASVFGGEAAARAVAARLAAGVVTVNDVIVPTADPRVPFGGRRRSGYGVTRGAEGLLEMTVVKAVSVRRRRRFLGLGSPLRRHRHLEPPRPGDEALFRAYLAVAHGSTLSQRLRGLAALLRAGLARWRAERHAAAEATLPNPTSHTEVR